MAKITTNTPDGDIKITPNGTGKTVVGTGAASATVQSSGDYNLVLQTGNATTGSITITDGANGNIAITPNGTGEVDISKVDIDGGTIDGTTIGGTTPAAGTFTTFTSTGIDDNASSGPALTIDSSGNTTFNSGNADVDFTVKGDNGNALFVDGGTNDISFYEDTGTAAKFFWDASAESLGIGNTSPDAIIRADSGTANQTLFKHNPPSNRYFSIAESSDGTYDNAITTFYKGATIGQFVLTTAAAERLRIDSSGNTRPGADNTYDLGTGSYRWNDAYVTNAVTTGSDGRQKQDIEELSEAEQRVAIACKGLLRKFRWKDMVAEKGDDARIHFGIIAQDLKAAFEAEGLDAGRYGMFIHSEWWETYTKVPAVEAQDAVYETQTDEEGNEVQVLVSEAVEAQEAYTRTDTFDTEEEAPEGAVKKDRMGVRYSELLAFIIAAI